MGYTYKDNEEVALKIVKKLQGQIIEKGKSKYNSCSVVFTTHYDVSDLESKIGKYIEKLIEGINPDCRLDIKWDTCTEEPKDSVMGDSASAVYAIRDTHYDDKNDDYYGTEIYIAGCGTPTTLVYALTVLLEGE